MRAYLFRPLCCAGLIGVLAVSCSSTDAVQTPQESTSQSTQFVTGNCTDLMFGHPCDPDGNGPLLECEGQCWLDTDSNVACVPVTVLGKAPADLNGYVCGSADGSSCTSHCDSGACVPGNAPVGAACRPVTTPNADSCTGRCTVQGPNVTCRPTASPCTYGRDACTFLACNMYDATCESFDLLPDTTCDDGDACTLTPEVCDDQGACIPGPDQVCPDDGNVCTTESCDSTDGSCISRNNTDPCDDGDACTENDTCAAGACVSGTAVDCDDHDVCTTDSCDSQTGCVNAPACGDGDMCTQDVCDPTDGSCTHPAVDCDDSDLCTDDSCDSASGCVNTATTCDDGDACTTDGCDPASGCTTAPRDCDDGDSCTQDTCDSTSGCVYTPIPGCTDGGTAGSSGAAGSAGATGTGGAAGSAGATGTGGAAGASGAPATGGAAGTTGTGGAAGTPGTGGSTPGTGGSAPGTGGTPGSGGSAATGGTTSDAGSVPVTLPEEDEGGCGCRVPAGNPTYPGILGLFFVGLATLVRRGGANH